MAAALCVPLNRWGAQAAVANRSLPDCFAVALAVPCLYRFAYGVTSVESGVTGCFSSGMKEEHCFCRERTKIAAPGN